MKLKINKACDLSSISVLPPQARRLSTAASGPEGSVFSRSQPSQLRSQPSQQSFSQGVSSQHGMFSQFSQNSLEGIIMNDQRFGSQERETSVKKSSCLPSIHCTREDSQMPISRSSSNLTCKWNSASLPDQRCQISEELEHRIRMVETSLSRFGMILDSIQSDIMQVNKGTKEVTLETESIRQKLVVHDNLLHLMNKGQEDIKASLDGHFKSISDQLNRNIDQRSLQDISSMLSALPEKIEACVPKLQNDLCQMLTNEMQAIACSLKIPNQEHLSPIVLPPKAITYRASPQEMSPLKNMAVCPKVERAPLVRRIEMGSWNRVKCEHANFMDRASIKGQKKKRISPIVPEREMRVIIESDEESDGGFSCLLKEKETGKYSIEDAKEAKEETRRILRKARRRKRKYCNTIILN